MCLADIVVYIDSHDRNIAKHVRKAARLKNYRFHSSPPPPKRYIATLCIRNLLFSIVCKKVKCLCELILCYNCIFYVHILCIYVIFYITVHVALLISGDFQFLAMYFFIPVPIKVKVLVVSLFCNTCYKSGNFYFYHICKEQKIDFVSWQLPIKVREYKDVCNVYIMSQIAQAVQ